MCIKINEKELEYGFAQNMDGARSCVENAYNYLNKLVIPVERNKECKDYLQQKSYRRRK